jgi:hypothetical protein
MTAWINARQDVSTTGPLTRGAFEAGQDPVRSPADGPYAHVSRLTGGVQRGQVAESDDPSWARISALVYAGTVDSAEAAAVALANAWHTLQGCPEPCGDTGVTVLVGDGIVEPAYIQQPAVGGEQFCFQVTGDFLLLKGD